MVNLRGGRRVFMGRLNFACLVFHWCLRLYKFLNKLAKLNYIPILHSSNKQGVSSMSRANRSDVSYCCRIHLSTQNLGGFYVRRRKLQ